MNKKFWGEYSITMIEAVRKLIEDKMKEDKRKGMILNDVLLGEIFDEAITEIKEKDLIDLQFQEALEKDDNYNN